jgi:hypothetical protein
VSFKPEDVRIPSYMYASIPKEPQKAPSSLDPSYYKRWKIEPLTFCMENDLPFWMGSVVKYIMRYDQKNGLEDLYKARVYLQKKIDELEAKKSD